jgi:hypothetical protein
MPLNGSPGEDGIPYDFYKQFWNDNFGLPRNVQCGSATKAGDGISGDRLGHPCPEIWQAQQSMGLASHKTVEL